MQNKALWCAVLALGAVQIANFVVSPETVGTIGKKHLGAEAVRMAAAKEFKRGGDKAMKEFCHQEQPIERFGYFYTCAVGYVARYDFDATEVWIVGFRDFETAKAAKNGNVSAILRNAIVIDREVSRSKPI